jgi:hypothetical protein
VTPKGTGSVVISKVDVDGGTIDGTTIGATTPAAAKVTALTTTSSDAIILTNSGGGTIRTDTGDGTDNKQVILASGGAALDSRGALIAAHGNEATSTGILKLYAGNVAGGHIVFRTGGTDRGQWDYSGNLLIGTTTDLGWRLGSYSATGKCGLFTTTTTVPTEFNTSSVLGVVQSGSANPGLQVIATDGSAFASTLCKLGAYRAANTAFNFISATADIDGTPADLFFVRGDGRVIGNSGCDISGAAVTVSRTVAGDAAFSTWKIDGATNDTYYRFILYNSGLHEWGPGNAGRDTNLYRSAENALKTDDKFLAVLGLGVGNSAAATTLGSVVKKMEVFDASGASLGFVPIYNSIT